MKGRAGLTLVELIVASALASILMVAIFRLLDTSLDLWAKGETRRAVVEQATGTAELLARDLRALHSGQQGDLLAEWVPFDADGDGKPDRLWPRLRFVRQASLADVARLASESIDPEVVAKARELGVEVGTLIPEEEREPPPLESGLIQVAWAVVPAGSNPDGKVEGLFLRGEELLAPGDVGTFFDEGFFSTGGHPPVGALREVTGGVLWLGLQFATQTSVVHDGWTVGDELRDTAGSWDAWNRGRPDPEAHFWNEPGAGMPAAEDRPLLPRRVLIELEFERPRDRQRRTRLAEELEKETTAFEVDNGQALPRGPGHHLLVGTEWMELAGLDGDRVRVRRGARGTAPQLHPVGAMVHHGEPVVVEVPIVQYVDDWNLGGSSR